MVAKCMTCLCYKNIKLEVFIVVKGVYCLSTQFSFIKLATQKSNFSHFLISVVTSSTKYYKRSMPFSILSLRNTT